MHSVLHASLHDGLTKGQSEELRGWLCADLRALTTH